MSKKTRWEKLLAMQRREDVFFIGDKHLKLYHHKDCTRVEGINKNDLVPCGTNPETAGFHPCKVCAPAPVLDPEQEVPTPVKISSPPKIKIPKDNPSGRALLDRATAFGMTANLIGPNIYISTIADEWYFNYTNTPIVLHHKNTEVRKYDDGRRMPGHYHQQPYHFQTPLEALAYINRHSEIAVGRSLKPEAAQLQLVSVPDYPPLLVCNGEPLETGSRVTALFPDGWRYIKLELSEGAGEEPQWVITTPEYSIYSPVGLFIRL